MIETVANTAQAANLLTDRNQYIQYKALYEQKKAVARTTLDTLKQSAKEAWKASKTRSLGKTAFAAANTAWLALEDIPWAASSVALFERYPSRAGTVLAIGGLATGVAVINHGLTEVSVRNMRDEGFNQPTSLETDSEQINRRSKFARHTGRFLKTMGKGPIFNAVQSRFSEKEALLHNIAYGYVGTTILKAAHEIVGVSNALKPLDNPLAFGAIAGVLVATDYVNEVCNRAAEAGHAETISMNARMEQS